MKNKRVITFLSLLVAYTGFIWLAVILPDYRHTVFVLLALNAVTFGVAAYAAIKPLGVKVVTPLLILVMTLAPAKAGPEQPPPQKNASVLVGCATIAIGAIIVWGIWKICKKIPAPPKKGAPAPTNEVDSIRYSLPSSVTGPALLLPDYDISLSNDWDIVIFDFQSTTNTRDWQTEYCSTNWLNGSSLISLIASNGVVLQVKQTPVRWTNDTPVIDFSSVMPSMETSLFKLWRAVERN